MGDVNEERLDISGLILRHEWSVYQDVIEAAAWQNLRFCLGGGLAFSAYSKRQRGMKDVDLFVLKQDREAFINLLTAVGYEDYYDREPYDRTWIYRGYMQKVVLDIIWTLPNHRLSVESDWFARGMQVVVHGQPVRLIPPEDVVRTKIYVLQHDRCDWTDLLNLFEFQGPELDWDYLLSHDVADLRLLGSLLNVFAWISPERAAQIPASVWDRLSIAPPAERALSENRACILDSRDWFGPGCSEARAL